MKAIIFDLETKQKVSDIMLDKNVFDIKIDPNFISMHFSRMRKAHHIKTNKTKHIAEVSGTTKKPYKQKHTGNARQGSLRSAQFEGGGIAFGPRAVQRNIKIPKSEVVLAKSMILSEMLATNKLFFVSNCNFSSHKSKEAKIKLSNFVQNSQNITIIHNQNVTPNSLLAVRNIKGIRYCSLSMLTTFDLMNSDLIIVDSSVVEKLTNNLLLS